jgi:hypothetical protein
MKKIHSILSGLLLTASVFMTQHTNAQAPQKMSYQSVIRNSSNVLLVNTQVGMKISVLQGTASGTAVYVENQTANTNANGLVSLQIGNGTATTGTFAGINWATGPYFIKTETDPAGGTTYSITGTQQMMSVPYALYAETTGQSGALTAWSKTGNAGTVDGTNFIGTTDNVPLSIRVNNQKAGRIDPTLNNSFWGYQAGNSNTTGYENTAIGSVALFNNTTGIRNSANGFNALYSNTTGGDNTANGYFALYSNTFGSANTANGVNTLRYNTTGIRNSANGYQVLFSNTTGSFNTANGNEALALNTEGNYNTANGNNALLYNTTGNSNVAVGTSALYSNTIASNLVAVGESALYNNTGDGNTAVGSKALYSNTTGGFNTANGLNALYSNTTGGRNTANGYFALVSNTTGARNVAIGESSLLVNTIGTQNTALGSEADVVTNALTNATAIGYGAKVDASNKIQLGNSSVTDVNTSGTYTAAGFKTPAGSSSQYLMADGSTSTGTVATTMGAIGGSSTANGGTITAGVLKLTPADATNGGLVTTGAQTFAGNKTFSSPIKITAGSPGAGKVLTSDATGMASWSSSSPCSYTIGQNVPALGGIIFYLDPSGCHGLVCAPTDQGTGKVFNYEVLGAFGIRPILSYAYGTGLFEGSHNTNLINNGNPNVAASVCGDLLLGNKNDWYLPSIEEFKRMYQNIGQGNAFGLGNVGGFTSTKYWSSSEISDWSAWAWDFTTGNATVEVNKESTYYVRAIRAF